MARPIPLAAPVTMAVLPSKFTEILYSGNGYISHPATMESKTNEQKRYRKYLMRALGLLFAINVKTREVRMLNMTNRTR